MNVNLTYFNFKNEITLLSLIFFYFKNSEIMLIKGLYSRLIVTITMQFIANHVRRGTILSLSYFRHINRFKKIREKIIIYTQHFQKYLAYPYFFEFGIIIQKNLHSRTMNYEAKLEIPSNIVFARVQITAKHTLQHDSGINNYVLQKNIQDFTYLTTKNKQKLTN